MTPATSPTLLAAVRRIVHPTELSGDILSVRIREMASALSAFFPSDAGQDYVKHLCAVPPPVAFVRLQAFALFPDLLREAGIAPASLCPVRDRLGRPYLTHTDGTRCAHLDFNLSHSARHAACALLLGDGQVGIDTEEPLPQDRADALTRRYASPEESRYIRDCDRTLPTVSPGRGFLRIWTMREALVKQAGTGEPWKCHADDIPSHLVMFAGSADDTGAAVSLCCPREAVRDVPPLFIGFDAQVFRYFDGV